MSRENFAPSLSMYIINCEEETMSPRNRSDRATVNVSFFSSGVADDALRLGPYMRRSRLK